MVSILIPGSDYYHNRNLIMEITGFSVKTIPLILRGQLQQIVK
jgi:hypothetical protein